ncbi:protein IWS1 homolog A-like isoform X2 [Penaeus indicus]|uniref:protein IWS1 homolog A-like isoform X2 n=1 Tax=Penaeus indicus TaxID=29960 RepID=UPI00300D7E5D
MKISRGKEVTFRIISFPPFLFFSFDFRAKGRLNKVHSRRSPLRGRERGEIQGGEERREEKEKMNTEENKATAVTTVEDKQLSRIPKSKPSTPKIGKPVRSFITGNSPLLQIPVNKLSRKPIQEKEDKPQLKEAGVTEDKENNSAMEAENGIVDRKRALSPGNEVETPRKRSKKEEEGVKKEVNVMQRKKPSVTEDDIKNILNKESEDDDSGLSRLDSSEEESGEENAAQRKASTKSDSKKGNKSNEDSGSDEPLAMKAPKTKAQKKEPNEDSGQDLSEPKAEPAKSSKMLSEDSSEDEEEVPKKKKSTQASAKGKNTKKKNKARKGDDSDDSDDDEPLVKSRGRPRKSSKASLRESSSEGSSSESEYEPEAKKGGKKN